MWDQIQKSAIINSDFEGSVWALTQPPAKTLPNLAGMGLNFFDTLPGSLSSAPEVFRPLTLFLRERRGTEVKKAPLFTSDFEGQYGHSHAPSKDSTQFLQERAKTFLAHCQIV